MEVTYLGHSSFRIKTRKTSIVTDPFDESVVGLKFPKVEAKIITISHDHKDHSRADLVKGVEKIVDGPGEYEIGGVSIIGFDSFHDNKKGKLRGKNTIYVFEVDGLRLAHLGDLGHKLSEKQIEDIGDINILFIPIGGEYTISAKEAAQVVRDFEPQITIPMHFQTKGLSPKTFSKLSGVDEFLKELSLITEKTDKLSLKASDLSEEQKIVVLEIK